MMNNHELLKSQKNEIYELIRLSELDPYNFEWHIMETYVNHYTHEYPRLGFKGTEFYFDFELYGDRHSAEFSPGQHIKLQKTDLHSWDDQKRIFIIWLNNLKREISEPDLWDELSKYQLPPEEEGRLNIDNIPFSAYQVEELTKGIENVRTYILNEFNADQEQQKLVNDKLDYLIESSKRQGRRDWLHLCIGVIVTISMALELSPEEMKTIWKLIENAVRGIIQLLPQ